VAGFGNVVLPLGIGAFVAAGPEGGFDSPIPSLRISGEAGAPPVADQGGFGTPIGALLVRSVGQQAGFVGGVIPGLRLGANLAGYVGVVPVIGLGATESGIIVPEDVHPPGMSRVWHEEDEEIMAIIMSFLEIRR
jgi:hypothetical protein